MIAHTLLKPVLAAWVAVTVAILPWPAAGAETRQVPHQPVPSLLDGKKPPVRIGVLAKRGHAQCLKQWGPTAQYLAAAIPGTKFAILPLGFDEIHDAVKQQDVEFILANSSYYIELEIRFGAKRIATLNNLQSDGSALNVFASAVFCKTSTPGIEAAADLKGKSFMAVDEFSLGGWQMAWRELLANGINPGHDFKRLEFGGTHDAVVLAVKNGIVDAGCVRSDTLERMDAEGKIRISEFKVLSLFKPVSGDIRFKHSTRPYPEWPFVKSAYTDEALSKAVAVALLTMPAGSAAARAANCAGWTIPQNYQPVRECLKALRLPPFQDYGKITLKDFITHYRNWILGFFALAALMAWILIRASHLKRRLRESVLTTEARERARRFLQTVINGFPEALMVINQDYTIALTNQTAREMAGGIELTSGCLKCYHSTDKTPPPCGEPTEDCPVRQVLDTKESVVSEHRCQTEAGQMQVFEIVAAPIFDAQNEAVQVIASFRDITERQTAEEKLRRNEAFLNTLLNAIPIPIFFKDTDLRYLGVNHAFESFFGENKEQLIGKTVFDTHPPDQAKIYDRKDRELLSDGESQKYETTMVTREGQMRDVILRKALFHDDLGNISGLIGTATDITARKRHEQVLAARLKLSKFSLTHSTTDLLRRFLDEAELLTGSSIGFFHFVEPDQKTLSLQTWSTNTLERMCDIDLSAASNTHYPISQAGVWVDCVKQRKPVVHNDYERLAGRKGLPDGHAPVVRELVIPIFRNRQIVAVLGVGNKKTVYNDIDIQTVSDIADMAWDIVQRKQAEDALRNSEEKYRNMMEAMGDPAYICSEDFSIEYMNPAMVKWLGQDFTGKHCYSSIYNFDSTCSWCPYPALKKEETRKYTVLNPRDGRHYDVSNSIIANSDGSVSKFTIFRDITETLNLEKQLRQVQKLEAIGTLAGGIAHDFNNILFAIMGYAEIALSSFTPQDPVYKDLEEILKAGNRAKELVQQILTFSRQTEQKMQPIKIQLLVKEALKLLKASLPATIEIRENLSSKSKIMGDPTQIHQIIMNLCTNGAHAMEENGGLMTVELTDMIVDKEITSQFINMPEGNYLNLKITDTGHGIKKEDLERIFEPFYTTKPEGKGTGMGLSLVHGIVKNHKGQISVKSLSGEGTTFEVYLPALAPQKELNFFEQKEEKLPGGTETILIIDDEDPIVKITQRSLSAYGYKVDGVSRPEHAIERFRQSAKAYDMVITDMTMPGMTGDILAEKLLQIRPDLPVVLITGYSNKIDLVSRPPKGIRKVLIKPVIKSDLLHTVRQIFDELSPPA